MNLQGTSITSNITASLPVPTNVDTTRTPFILDIRSLSAVDLNGDGYLDIFIHPSYVNSGPSLAPIALLNDGHGGFYDGTASVFPVALDINQSNGAFFEDFNNDGKTDLFVVDQGLEIGNAYVGGFPGSSNHLYLSSETGMFQNSSDLIQNNTPSFNHISSIVDINGDGNLDVLVTRLGGPSFSGSGTFFYLGDGKGGFSFSTAGLPDVIRYKTNAEFDWNTKTIDYQFSGTAGAGDFNGDGREDIVTGSYIGGDQLTNKQTVRVFQNQSSGNFVQMWQADAPAALKNISNNLGVAGISTGDLDGDGLTDIVVFWEGDVGGVQILKNLGGFQFSDVTNDWLGSYLPRSSGRDGTGNVVELYSGISLADINHDGKLDLLLKSMGSSASQTVAGLATGAFAYLNDGAGHLSPDIPSITSEAVSATQLSALAGTNDWDLGIPMIFDANNDGKSDYVFVSPSMRPNRSNGSTDPYTLHVATLFGSDTGNVYRANDISNVLTGSSGNDSIYGGNGSDVIDGGLGVDVVYYSGLRSGYVVSNTSFGWTIKSSISTLDTLSNIERLHFSDQNIALDVGVNGDAGKALEFIGAIAQPLISDPSIIGAVLSVVDQIPDMHDLCQFAINIGLIKNLAGSDSNADLVKLVFKNIVGVDADAATVSSLAGLIQGSGGTMSQADFLAAVAELPINQQHVNLVGFQTTGVEYV